MNKTGPNRHTAQSPGLQKLLLICGALVVCALVFIFVRLQPEQQVPVVAVHTSRPSPAPSPTALPGVREARVLDALSQTELVLGEYNRDTSTCSVAVPDAAREDVAYEGRLELLKREGLVRGFLLEMAALRPPARGKPQNAYEQGQYEGKLLRYEMDLELQRQLVHMVLSELLAVLDSRGDVPPGTSLLWENEVEGLQEGGQSFSEQVGDYTFLAVHTRTGRLQISLSK